MPATKNPVILERNAQSLFGCSRATALLLNEGAPLRQPGSRASRYLYQRTAAGKRGIGWEITFPEWLSIWMESGHWEQRGVGIGTYCMSRHRDIGPYKVGNVSIKTNVENSREGIEKARPAMRLTSRRQAHLGGPSGQLGRGRGWTFVAARKTPYQVVVGSKYIGSFATQQEAEAAYRAAVSEIRVSHGTKFCPAEPLNTTQLIGEGL